MRLFTNLLVVIMVTITLLLISCTTIPPEKQCSVDKDCRPANCCHPTDAVNIKSGPDCRNKMCTLECVPDTLDCGQGEVKCVSGACKAVFK